jgi:hypothetical protein
LVGFFAGHLLFIFSLIDLSAAVTVVEPCLYTYTLERCLYTYTLGPSRIWLGFSRICRDEPHESHLLALRCEERCFYTGPSHHQNGCKSALEDADIWSGSIDRLRYTQELRAFKHERRISLRARWGGLDHLSHSETLFSGPIGRFWSILRQLHNTDMGGRLERCMIHANIILGL